MDRTTHLVRLSKWQKIIECCNKREPGTTVKQWLEANGISDKTYYYWLRKVRTEAFAQMNLPEPITMQDATAAVTFAEIPTPTTTGGHVDSPNSNLAAVLRSNAFMIELYNNASPELIQAILQVVNHAG